MLRGEKGHAWKAPYMFIGTGDGGPRCRKRNPAPDMTTRNSRPSEPNHASSPAKIGQLSLLRKSALKAGLIRSSLRDSDEAMTPDLISEVASR